MVENNVSSERGSIGNLVLACTNWQSTAGPAIQVLSPPRCFWDQSSSLYECSYEYIFGWPTCPRRRAAPLFFEPGRAQFVGSLLLNKQR